MYETLLPGAALALVVAGCGQTTEHDAGRSGGVQVRLRFRARSPA
jgi:hypothetical protein